MQFNSYSYLLILSAVVAIFWLLPAALRRLYVLLISLGFYIIWAQWLALVPIALAFVVFSCGARARRRADSGRFWMLVGITCSLLCLVFFRFHTVFAAALGAALPGPGHRVGRVLFSVAVPLGISFYSFDAIGLLLDSYQGRVKEWRFADVLQLLVFWPSATSGPIVRYRELIPQFRLERDFDPRLMVSGLDRLVLGLAQKNLIANNLNGWVAEGFLSQNWKANSTIDNWFLAIAFGLQIYFDFAAYTNMAIGAARLIGVKLPENFKFPYHAANPPDFWSRWHMSLSRWIRDYLFFPLNMRFKGAPLPLYGSLVAIMALVGLWHGVGWGFLLWGVLHGCYLVAYRVFEKARDGRWPRLGGSLLVSVAWRAVTVMAVFAAWVPFRATSVEQAVGMLRSMFFGREFGISYQLNFYLVTILVAGWCFAEPYVAQVVDRIDTWSVHTRLFAGLNLYLGRPLVYAFCLVLFFAFDERNTRFIYFQF